MDYFILLDPLRDCFGLLEGSSFSIFREETQDGRVLPTILPTISYVCKT
jgi:hypothetical protein